MNEVNSLLTGDDPTILGECGDPLKKILSLADEQKDGNDSLVPCMGTRAIRHALRVHIYGPLVGRSLGIQ